MMFLLDTDHLTILTRKEGKDFESLAAGIARYSEADFFVSVVSFHEQMLGWHNYIANSNNWKTLCEGYVELRRLLEQFSGMQVLDFDLQAASKFAELRSQQFLRTIDGAKLNSTFGLRDLFTRFLSLWPDHPTKRSQYFGFSCPFSAMTSTLSQVVFQFLDRVGRGRFCRSPDSLTNIRKFFSSDHNNAS